MNLEYYLFAFYIFALTAGVLLLAKALFWNLRKKTQKLEEKENELLTLYSNVEEVISDLCVKINASASEFRTIENLRVVRQKAEEFLTAEPQPSREEILSFRQIELPAVPPEKRVAAADAPEAASADLPSVSETVKLAGDIASLAPDAPEPAAAAEPESAETGVPSAQPPSPPQSNAAMRRRRIVRLSGEGRTAVEIADELGITLREVNLVIGLQRSVR
ncbi:MAG: hypothetical protein LBS90_04505 [Oscillospiraceae bacterium]|jgi:hypothetical protein|nr:hypothetical protein [Oscillospiraceae bacterium]